MVAKLHVEGLWRYPVKSMLGEALSVAELDADGIAGDRRWAVQDLESGHIASAKHPRKWARLLACRAICRDAVGDQVRIELPTGASLYSGDPELDRALSAWLGRPVRLIRQAPPGALRESDRSPPEDLAAGLIRTEPLALASAPGSFFDVAPLHLLTRAGLDALQALSPGSEVSPVRFRPNLLLAGAAAPQGQLFPELDWLGQRLRGEAASGPELALIDPSPRCVVITQAQPGLEPAPELLQALARHSAAASLSLAPGAVFQAVAGVYATVRQAGRLAIGDRLCLLP